MKLLRRWWRRLVDRCRVTWPEQPDVDLHRVRIDDLTGERRRSVSRSRAAPLLTVPVPPDVFPFLGPGERLIVVGASRRDDTIVLLFESQRAVPPRDSGTVPDSSERVA